MSRVLNIGKFLSLKINNLYYANLDKYIPKNTAAKPTTKLAIVYKKKVIKSPDFKKT